MLLDEERPLSTSVVRPTPAAIIDSAIALGMNSDVSASQTVTLIEPPKGLQSINGRELWRYRELLAFFVWRDVAVRYKQTLLGVAWAIVQPTILMLIFTFVLGQTSNDGAGNRTPYPLFVFSGLLLWIMFANAVSAASMSLVYSEQLITKVYFPRLIVPFAAVGTAVIDFFCGLVVLMGLMAWYGIIPSWQIAAAGAAWALTVLAALAVGTFLAAINVRFRDFRLITPFFLQAWMLATPAIYLPSTTESAAVNGWMALIVSLNPLNGLVAFFRAAFVGNSPVWTTLLWDGLWIAICFMLACLYFRRVESTLADVI